MDPKHSVIMGLVFAIPILTPGRRQIENAINNKKNGSKINRNSVIDCHLMPVWRQMAIKNSVSSDF